MAEILYYIPGVQGEALDERAALGLDGTLGRANINARGLSQGPDGGRGVLFSRALPDFVPDRQRWEPAAGVWLGCWIEDPPGPEDLLRPEGPGGRPVKLADGQEWLVPAVWPIGSDEYALPRVYRLAEDGTTREDIPAHYRPLVEAADQLVVAVRRGLDLAVAGKTGSPIEIEVPDPFEIAAEALLINYRVGRREAGFLKLLTTANYQHVFAAMINWAAAEAAAQKEKAGEG